MRVLGQRDCSMLFWDDGSVGIGERRKNIRLTNNIRPQVIVPKKAKI